MTRRSPRRRAVACLLEPVEPRRLFAISFLPAVQSPGGDASLVATGDFTGDGLADVVAVRPASVDPPRFFLGLGDGRFAASVVAAPINAGANIVGLATADLNRDGRLDLLAATAPTALFNGGVSVLLGNGNGTFQPVRRFAAGPYPTSIAVGDFNRDGKADVAVGDRETWPPASSTSPPRGHGAGVLFGSGDGNLAAPSYLPTVGPVYSVAAEAPRSNLLPSPAANLSPLLGVAGLDPRLAGPLPVSFVALYSLALTAVPVPFAAIPVLGDNRGLTVGDFNRDGRLDAAALQTVGGNTGANTSVSVTALVSGVPSSTAPTGYSARGPFATGLASGYGIASADFDRDGRLDLAAAGTRALGSTLPAFVGGVAALGGTGSGAFGAPAFFATGSTPGSIGVATVNRDARPDVVVGSAVGLSALLGRPSPIVALDAIENDDVMTPDEGTLELAGFE